MKAIRKILLYLLNPKVLFTLYIAIVVLSFIQLLVEGHTNNFSIFRASSHHLLHQLPLYTYYPAEYDDLFFYHPVFPVLFLPFALLSVKLGILAWLLFTSLTCFFAFRQLPVTNDKRNVFTALLLFDLLNNLNHTQTNPLLLAFMLLSWAMVQKDKPFLAALFMVLSFLIKGYGGIIGILCFYHKQWYKIIGYALCWFLLLNAMLLFFIPPAQVLVYYTDWLAIISGNTILESFSVYGILKNLHIVLPEWYILLTALVVLLFYITVQIMISERKMEEMVAFLLVWVIVFNRASEPATYIIAMGGVVLWYLCRPKTLFSTVLFWATILTASIFPTDISKWFDKLRYDYYLKTILCLFVLADMVIYSTIKLYHQRAVKMRVHS